MRTLAAPIVVARPTGARIRTRLRLTPADAAVVWAVGEHLGRLSGADLAWRCRLGHASGPGGDRRTDRKRALTAPSSSRWAGAITRTSNDQWERAYHNLLDTRAGLRRARSKLRARLAIPAGQIRRSGRHRLRGYQSQSERFEKQRRLQHLQARLARSRSKSFTVGCRCAGVAVGWPSFARPSTLVMPPADSPRSSGDPIGRLRDCLSPPMGRPASGGATRPSGSILTRAG